MRCLFARARGRSGVCASGVGVLLLAASMSSIGLVTDTMSSAQTCPVARTVAVEIDQSAGGIGGYWGRAVGQTFFAEGLAIGAFTVWRWPTQDTTFASIHLYIMETDSTGRPRPDRLIVSWPQSLNRFGDGVNPIEYRFEFDPPIVLARRDTYAVFLASDPCYGWFDVYATFDEYPGGSAWRTWRSSDMGCGLRANPEHYPGVDLCFKIEFCDSPTPAGRETWGRLKIRYR